MTCGADEGAPELICGAVGERRTKKVGSRQLEEIKVSHTQQYH